MSGIIVYMTCPTQEEAERIGAALLEKRLIACTNIMSPHTALYRWKGQVESGREFAVIMKTRPDLFEKVEETIIELHSYECPCIVSWPVEKGHAPFLDWIEAETVN